MQASNYSVKRALYFFKEGKNIKIRHLGRTEQDKDGKWKVSGENARYRGIF